MDDDDAALETAGANVFKSGKVLSCLLFVHHLDEAPDVLLHLMCRC